MTRCLSKATEGTYKARSGVGQGGCSLTPSQRLLEPRAPGRHRPLRSFGFVTRVGRGWGWWLEPSKRGWWLSWPDGVCSAKVVYPLPHPSPTAGGVPHNFFPPFQPEGEL